MELCTEVSKPVYLLLKRFVICRNIYSVIIHVVYDMKSAVTSMRIAVAVIDHACMYIHFAPYV